MIILKLILMLVLIFVLVYFSKQKELFFHTDFYEYDSCNEIWSEDESTMRSNCNDVDGCIKVNGWCENVCWEKTEGDCTDGCIWNSEYSYCDVEYDNVDTQCWGYNTKDICNKHNSCNWSEPPDVTSLRCVTDDSNNVSTTAASTTAAGDNSVGDNSAGTIASGDNGGVKKNPDKECIEICNLYKVNTYCANRCR